MLSEDELVNRWGLFSRKFIPSSTMGESLWIVIFLMKRWGNDVSASLWNDVYMLTVRFGSFIILERAYKNIWVKGIPFHIFSSPDLFLYLFWDSSCLLNIKIMYIHLYCQSSSIKCAGCYFLLDYQKVLSFRILLVQSCKPPPTKGKQNAVNLRKKKSLSSIFWCCRFVDQIGND